MNQLGTLPVLETNGNPGVDQGNPAPAGQGGLLRAHAWLIIGLVLLHGILWGYVHAPCQPGKPGFPTDRTILAWLPAPTAAEVANRRSAIPHSAFRTPHFE